MSDDNPDRKRAGEEQGGDVDDRSSMAKAIDWSSRVISASLMMVLPCAAGYWLDQKLGTRVAFTILGLVFGMIGGISQLIKMAKQSELG